MTRASSTIAPDLVAALDQCGGHPPELAVDQRLELSANLSADVMGPHGPAEHVAERSDVLAWLPDDGVVF
jgi:hypothetical protein